MAKEIERKFLVKDNSFTMMTSEKRHIRQAYLSVSPESTVRIRVSDDRAWITVKGKNSGAVRDEWEYPIPENDAEEMALRLTGGWAIDKTRHIVMYCGFCWEVDVFHGRHEGLIVAEVELPDETIKPPLPPFIGKEVTGDPAYYNSVLSVR
ncbi:MAG: CYTH domain-containing protein [Paenibacillus sp.]|nr:CYTH domain-containing protein [Paenibacillus sp.]